MEGLKGGGGREDWYKHESKYASFVTTGSGVVSLKHKCVHFGSDLLVSQPHPLVILEGHKMLLNFVEITTASERVNQVSYQGQFSSTKILDPSCKRFYQ